MGQRGPKSTPTALLKLRGSWRGEVRDGEPTPDVECPPCPSWLMPKAKTYWPEIAEMLTGLGVMASVHTLALSLLIDAMADWIKFSNEAEIDTKQQRHKRAAWEAVLKACREFGMTPSSIAGIRAVKQDEKPQGLASLKLA